MVLRLFGNTSSHQVVGYYHPLRKDLAVYPHHNPITKLKPHTLHHKCTTQPRHLPISQDHTLPGHRTTILHALLRLCVCLCRGEAWAVSPSLTNMHGHTHNHKSDVRPLKASEGIALSWFPPRPLRDTCPNEAAPSGSLTRIRPLTSSSTPPPPSTHQPTLPTPSQLMGHIQAML